MEFDKVKIKDYATTLLLMAGAAVIAYQPQVMQYVPSEYSLLVLIGLGIVSQITADQRAKIKITEGLQAVDQVQAKADEYKVKYEEAMAKVDEVQLEIAKVAALKELDAA